MAPKKQQIVQKSNPATNSTTQPIKTPKKPSQTTNNKHVLFFIVCTNEGILPKHVEIIENKLKNISGNVLYLILYTVGGDIYSAVKIMRILQSKFKEIKVIIPNYAYSSGTIMSLGGDEIYMAVDATLGPLDKPLEHPTDGSEISSLDITQTLTNLASICISTASSIYTKLREDGSDMKLSKTQAAKLSLNTATKIISPITNKIDPYSLQRGFREAKIGLYYAIDMLVSRMMKTDVSQAIKTSRSLVDNYPSHGYGIFREEAQDVLKLNIHNLESFTEWTQLESKYKDLKDRYSSKIEYTVI